MIDELARVLRPGGVAVLDTAPRDYVAARGRVRHWFELPDGTLRLHRADFDPLEGRSQEALIEVTPTGERTTKAWSTRLFTPTDIDAMLRRAGLEPAEFCGGFDLVPYAPDSPRLVVAATKPETAAMPPTDSTTASTWRDAIDRFACPATGQALHEASDEELAAITGQIDDGGVSTVGGELVTEPVDAALVRADGAVAYRVRDGIPVLFADEALALEG